MREKALSMRSKLDPLGPLERQGDLRVSNLFYFSKICSKSFETDLYFVGMKQASVAAGDSNMMNTERGRQSMPMGSSMMVRYFRI
jgi:hypothetical protein